MRSETSNQNARASLFESWVYNLSHLGRFHSAHPKTVGFPTRSTDNPSVSFFRFWTQTGISRNALAIEIVMFCDERERETGTNAGKPSGLANDRRIRTKVPTRSTPTSTNLRRYRGPPSETTRDSRGFVRTGRNRRRDRPSFRRSNGALEPAADEGIEVETHLVVDGRSVAKRWFRRLACVQNRCSARVWVLLVT